jgi:hypothetical protein
VRAADRLSLAAAALASCVMLARSLDSERRARPAQLVLEARRPASVAWGIDRGDPSQPGWLDAVRPLASVPTLVPLVLLALVGSEERPAEVRAFLEQLRNGGSPLERTLASSALEPRQDR